MKHLRGLQVFLIISLLSSCSLVYNREITEAEALDFAKTYQQAVSEKNAANFRKLIHLEAFGRRVATHIDPSANTPYLEEIQEAVRQRNFTSQLLSSIGSGEDYQFLRYYKKDGKAYLLFRLYGNSSVNYHDIELVRNKTRIQIADMFLYVSGQYISESVGDAIGTLLSLDKRTGSGASEYSASMRYLKSLVSQGEYAEAKMVYDELPARLRNNKMLLLQNIQICSQLDSNRHKEALEEFRGLYHDDPSSQLTLINAYFMNGDYNAALLAIDKVDAEVKDPFLHYYRAMVYKKRGDINAAVVHLEKLCKGLPEFEDGLIELIAAHLENNNEARSTELSRIYRANKNFDQEKIKLLATMYPALQSE